jgi:hypothetical protein
MSEYTVIAEISSKISKAIPLEKVCFFGCGVSTGRRAVWNTYKQSGSEFVGGSVWSRCCGKLYFSVALDRTSFSFLNITPFYYL